MGHPVSLETKKKISETAKRNKISGGYRHGSGRGKQGWYHAYWCDSTYELAFVIYCIDHNIKFSRSTIKYPYKKDGETHYYLPDFKMENGDLVEIKGYLTLDTLLKISAVKDRKIKVLFYEDIKYMFDYVSEKYDIHRDNLFMLYTKPLKVYKEKRKNRPSFKKEQKEQKHKNVEVKKKFYFVSECVWCGKLFISPYKRRCCSSSCMNKLRRVNTNRDLQLLTLITNSDIDLMKFGYNTKLCEMFPELSKKRILFLLRKYDIPHFERVGAHRTNLRF